MFYFLLSFLIKTVYAQGYQPLAPGIPGVADAANSGNLSTYLEGMFEIGISIAAALAVIMIIIGGIQYMSTDAVGGKEEGKSRITSAVWGLLLALVSWLILNTINPQLVSTSVSIPQEKVDGIQAGQGQSAAGAAGAAAGSGMAGMGAGFGATH